MQLILAIDSDPRRSEQLASLVRARLEVDLVQATSAGEGLHALRDRVPDLILTSPLLSPFDDGVLDEYLRDLGTAATHVQTVRIPMLSTGPRKKSAATRLFSLGRKKTQTSSAAPDGCDPKLFADEIAHYLTRSLEGRAASPKAAAHSTATVATEPQRETRAVAQPVDEWGPPQTVIEEFREPVFTTPEPIATHVEFEATHVPGSILDLRAPIVHAPRPQPQVVLEPEPVAYAEPIMHSYVEPVMESYVEPVMQAYVEPVTEEFVEPAEPAWVEPEPPMFVESVRAEREEPVFVEPVFFEPEAPAIVEPEASPIVEPVAALNGPTPVDTPAAPPATAGTSASFEAALAAIRAAWAKPEPKTTAAPETATPAGGTKPLAGSGEVDLTNEIDALEDVTGANGSNPAADDNDSPDESSTPTSRRKVEKPKKRQEKPRGSRMRGPDGRDEWGVFDPNQCGFSALVNKLDEVTDDDVVTSRATPIVR